MVVGSVVPCRPRRPATSADVKYWSKASCAGACKYMFKQSPPSVDGRQAQWVTRTFSVDGVVRDSLRVSDADDQSQLTTVESIKSGPFRWR